VTGCDFSGCGKKGDLGEIDSKSRQGRLTIRLVQISSKCRGTTKQTTEKQIHGAARKFGLAEATNPGWVREKSRDPVSAVDAALDSRPSSIPVPHLRSSPGLCFYVFPGLPAWAKFGLRPYGPMTVAASTADFSRGLGDFGHKPFWTSDQTCLPTASVDHPAHFGQL
jgi:hypothetical protein